MPNIGPAKTHKELKQDAEQTLAGKAHKGLPGVTTDVLPGGAAHKINRELANRINLAVHALKPNDDGGARFVLGWRLYPNSEHPCWSGTVHACGCGCACSSTPSSPDTSGVGTTGSSRKRKAGSPGKKKARKKKG